MKHFLGLLPALLLFSLCACTKRGDVICIDDDTINVIDDTVNVIVVGHELKTVDEAVDDAFGGDRSQDSLRQGLRRVIKEKYQRMGDSIQRKLLKGEKIH